MYNIPSFSYYEKLKDGTVYIKFIPVRQKVLPVYIVAYLCTSFRPLALPNFIFNNIDGLKFGLFMRFLGLISSNRHILTHPITSLYTIPSFR